MVKATVSSLDNAEFKAIITAVPITGWVSPREKVPGPWIWGMLRPFESRII